jgi:hypothetical protein
VSSIGGLVVERDSVSLRQIQEAHEKVVMNTRNCHNLVEWLEGVILLCEKGEGFYVPKLSELKQYCKNKDYNDCPFYTKFKDARPDINVASLNRKATVNEIYCK